MKRNLPLLFLLALFLALANSLLPKPVRYTPMLGQKPPAFALPLLNDERAAIAFPPTGRVTVVSAFASWCSVCRYQHPVMMTLKESGAQIVGIAWRDDPEKTRRWLAELGNPYARVATDADGISTTRLGISGVPETFVFDKDGKVAYHMRGAIDDSDVREKILPLLKEPKHEHE